MEREPKSETYPSDMSKVYLVPSFIEDDEEEWDDFEEEDDDD